MLHLVYDVKYGKPIRDGAPCDKKADLLTTWSKLDYTAQFITGTANLVHAMRVRVKRGNVLPEDIRFIYRDTAENKIIMLITDKNGRLDHWPDGFCDYEDRMYEELLDWNKEK